MIDGSPESHPPIDTIEVVILRDIDANRVDLSMQSAIGAPTVTLHEPDATRIAQLWRELAPGEQSRCHIPTYGLRFRSGERIVCEASVCWECDNIFDNIEGEPFHYASDAGHPTSMRLLAEIRRAVGEGGFA